MLIITRMGIYRMSINVKDIRRKAGMTQREFAEEYGIPLSTLRKWEQGESSPPKYVLRLIAYASAIDNDCERIQGRHGEAFTYDRDRSLLRDARGNSIHIHEDLSGVNESNLSLYVSELFADFYAIQEKFDRDCRFDKVEGIEWL